MSMALSIIVSGVQRGILYFQKTLPLLRSPNGYIYKFLENVKNISSGNITRDEKHVYTEHHLGNELLVQD